jgi:hypothetical protein
MAATAPAMSAAAFQGWLRSAMAQGRAGGGPMRSIIICIMDCIISMRFSIIGWRVAK